MSYATTIAAYAAENFADEHKASDEAIARFRLFAENIRRSAGWNGPEDYESGHMRRLSDYEAEERLGHIKENR